MLTSSDIQLGYFKGNKFNFILKLTFNKGRRKKTYPKTFYTYLEAAGKL